MPEFTLENKTRVMKSKLDDNVSPYCIIFIGIFNNWLYMNMHAYTRTRTINLKNS